MNQRLAIALFLIGLISCGGKEAVHSRMNKVTDPSPLKFDNTSPPQAVNKWISQAKTLTDVFKLERVIKLEDAEIAHLGLVIDIQRINDRWFLLDEILGQVVCYDSEGRFMWPVGEPGQGPGGYGRPTSLSAWGDKLLVVDGERAEYLVFNVEGEFLKSYNSRSAHISASKTIFNGDRAYLMGFSALTENTPYHAIMQIQEGKLTSLTGFGNRPSYAVSRKPTANAPILPALQSFALVGDRLWMGEPLGSTIDVYDLEGRFVDNLKTGVVGLQMDHSTTGDNDINSLLNECYINFKLVPVANYVIAFFIGKTVPIATIFTAEGMLLVSSIEAPSPLCSVFSESSGDGLVTVLDSNTLRPDNVQGYVDDSDLKLLFEAGLDPDSKEEAFFLFESMPRRN